MLKVIIVIIICINISNVLFLKICLIHLINKKPLADNFQALSLMLIYVGQDLNFLNK
jgi:hypothetical protein